MTPRATIALPEGHPESVGLPSTSSDAIVLRLEDDRHVLRGPYAKRRPTAAGRMGRATGQPWPSLRGKTKPAMRKRTATLAQEYFRRPLNLGQSGGPPPTSRGRWQRSMVGHVARTRQQSVVARRAHFLP